ncbi:MAG: S1 RNA-binding domain-containing protein [Nanoarchaeota archaeon]|nr:S1 RNA-binding domain-containing protein [Nanoarchaeota archaeon]
MLRQKTGLPEEGELAMCTVLKVHHNSVFVKLNEYGDTGLVHISEVAPGRIRNIREYVKEGKVIVCKVLRINKERGYIDLSLRRVTEMQRRSKVNELKQEQMAEKILEMAARKHKQDIKDIFAKIEKEVYSKYDLLYSVFEEVITNENVLEELKFPKELIPDLIELTKQRIKPLEVTVDGKFTIKSYEPDGVELIKIAIKKGQKKVPDTDIKYLGGGNFKVRLVDSNYKDAEKRLKLLNETITKEIEKSGGKYAFTRAEK